jgi:hypothetical protein
MCRDPAVNIPITGEGCQQAQHAAGTLHLCCSESTAPMPTASWLAARLQAQPADQLPLAFIHKNPVATGTRFDSGAAGSQLPLSMFHSAGRTQ